MLKINNSCINLKHQFRIILKGVAETRFKRKQCLIPGGYFHDNEDKKMIKIKCILWHANELCNKVIYFLSWKHSYKTWSVLKDKVIDEKKTLNNETKALN